MFVPLLALAGIALSACTSSTGTSVGFDKTPETGEVIHFASSQAPEGWTVQNTGGSGINATVDAEHPDPFIKGECYFTRSVEYSPAGYVPRGDDYNTKQFVYDMGKAFNVAPAKPETVSVKTEDGSIDLLSSSISYDDKSAGKTTTRFAVRAISEVKKSGYEVKDAPENPYVKNPAEGIPMVFLKVDCVKGETVSDAEWKKLVDSTQVSLNSPAPAANGTTTGNTGPFTPAPIAPPATESAPASPSAESPSSPSTEPK